MGMSSDWAIEMHDAQMETDDDYAAAYEERCREEWEIEEDDLTYFPDFHDTVAVLEGIETVWQCIDCGGTGEVVSEFGFPNDLEPTQIIEDCENCAGTGFI